MVERIVSIGECMLELAPAQEAGLFQLAYAGDTLNTAWYVKQLNPRIAVDFVTSVGRDDMSEQMVSFLDSQGIGTGFISRSPDRTAGLYMITLKDGERSFSYWRGQSAARQLADDPSHLAAACLGSDIAYFSGITLAILAPDRRKALLAALQRARESGALIAFDSNLRPRLWEDAATMRASVMEAAGVSDIVLPSHDDEATHFGDADPEATLARYGAAGAKTVVVKNGGGGIVFQHGGTQGAFVPGPVADIVDTTAAGDSFNAAILAGYNNAAPFEVTVAQASDLAGQVIRGRGALVRTGHGMP